MAANSRDCCVQLAMILAVLLPRNPPFVVGRVVSPAAAVAARRMGRHPPTARNNDPLEAAGITEKRGSDGFGGNGNGDFGGVFREEERDDGNIRDEEMEYETTATNGTNSGEGSDSGGKNDIGGGIADNDKISNGNIVMGTDRNNDTMRENGSEGMVGGASGGGDIGDADNDNEELGAGGGNDRGGSENEQDDQSFEQGTYALLISKDILKVCSIWP